MNNGNETDAKKNKASDPSYYIDKKETVTGDKPGDVRVRIVTHKDFRRIGAGYYIPRHHALDPKSGIGRLYFLFKRFLFGSPIESELEGEERLDNPQALAVLSSDALSSVAYGTEEIMRVLILCGTALLALTLPLSLAIVVLIGIVVISYQQTIRAYPSGGGSYIVASENLGRLPGLTAAAALMIDYVLTVAVSSAAGVNALTSAFPNLFAHRVEITLAVIVLIALINLRGIRQSGNMLSIPTYIFIVSMLVMIGIGVFSYFTGRAPHAVPYPMETMPQALTLFLLLSAFSQGCSAMTGIEAVSNGIKVFKSPESKNARKVLIWMGVLLAVMFFGVSFLATRLGVTPDPREQETIVSQMARLIIGGGPFYYLIQFSTAIILLLAMNTSYADFPRLSSILAKDRFAPSQFAFRGERLAFNYGIIALTGISMLLVWVFHGSVNALIPLYAVGVFTAFTLSQAGMVVHWWRERGEKWKVSMIINGVGALTTGIVTLVIAVTKFSHGAWMVLIAIPLVISVFLAIHRHYELLAKETAFKPEELSSTPNIQVVVPVSSPNLYTQKAINFARSLSQNISAVHVSENMEEINLFKKEWDSLFPDIPLTIVESPFRQLLTPLIAFIDALRDQYPEGTIAVVMPEFIPTHWWQHFLHNQTALKLKAALLFHHGVIVLSVPYHLNK
ncbi:MAG: APC family permease [Chloroflexi bacterium]|nr:APC family permease [Chloroflexota bacterium]